MNYYIIKFIQLAVMAWLFIMCTSLILYIPRLLAWFGAVKPQKRLINDKQNRLAVMIPARNESKVIEDLLKSLDTQTYPHELFDVHVITADRSDPTLSLLSAHSRCFGHVVENQTCKGDALDGCFQDIFRGPKRYDAYIVIDADCMLDEKFMEEMNHALASGAQVILSKKAVKNYLSKNKNALSLSACCNGLIWTLIDDMGNRFKSDHGYTIMTIGTGLMLRADLIEELGNGWPYRETVTEDMELMNDLAVRKVKTYYQSHALLYMEEATALSVTNKRRNRWMTGLIDSARIYRRRLTLATNTLQEHRNRYYVTALEPVYFYIGSSAVFAFLMLLLSVLLILVHNVVLAAHTLTLAAAAVGIIYLSFFIMTFFCIVVDYKHIKLDLPHKLLLLFVHPLFYMGYIPIVGKALLGIQKHQWDAIERIDFEEAQENMKAVERVYEQKKHNIES